MSESLWSDRFLDLFNRSSAKYRSGNSDFNTYFSAEDLAFLASIGCKPREFFDFVEDEIPAATSLLVASVRRAYFILEQNRQLSSHELLASHLPAKDATTDGIRWFPRILAKARGKLRGELHPDVMYGCGGDRNFLGNLDIPLADFLQVVWKAGDDDDAVLAYVKAKSA